VKDSAIGKMADAVFSKPDVWVAEAYSSYDARPQVFESSSDLRAYLSSGVSGPKGSAFVFIVYPDMKGKAEPKEIVLDPKRVKNGSKRFTWDGFGLISLQLHAHDETLGGVSANSEKRALKWAATHPEWASPNTWNWKAVTAHQMRLHRVYSTLSKSAG